jgi:hypothetical protein
MIRIAAGAAVLTLLAAAPAFAEEGARDLCANRPGRGSPPCVLDVGRFQVEASVVDFTHDSQAGTTTDTTLYGDLAFRLGVTPTGEAQLAFSPYVQVRQKDASGSSRTTGYSDLTLAWRQSLKNPDGSGTSIAIQPFVSAPVGKTGIGAGAWQGGVVAPMSFALPPVLGIGGFGLALTPQVAVVRNAAHDGGHLAWTGVVGISHPVGPFSLGAEIYVNYDDDPAGHATRETFDLAAAWSPPALKDTQLDLGVNAGLNRQTPDYEVYAGVAHRF